MPCFPLRIQELNRRIGRGCLLAALFAVSLQAHVAEKSGPSLTPPAEILEQVRPARPLHGGKIPADLKRRLGTAHVNGRYHFTDKPFLIEGAERVHQLGLGGIKLWFASIERAYRFNSQWNLSADYSYVDLVRHPYFQEALALPFSVIALELYPAALRDTKGLGLDLLPPGNDFKADEDQAYALTKYLLETFCDREVVFLLQNWEGDWMFRGASREAWLRNDIPDLAQRIDTFTHWFNARQRGVERARHEIPESKCRVFHAVEVNKVFDSLQNLPTLTTHVLPHIRPDFISWSCYDGLKTENLSADKTMVGMWQGLEIIQHYARTTQQDSQGRPAVYIGEIGFPEQVVPADAAVEMMDGAMAVLFARDVPYIFHWEIFCNERKDGDREVAPGPDKIEELRGFWLVRPDGTLGETGKYFQQLLEGVGHSLPQGK